MEELPSDIFIGCPECISFTLNASLEKDHVKLTSAVCVEYSGSSIGNSFIHSSTQKNIMCQTLF